MSYFRSHSQDVLPHEPQPTLSPPPASRPTVTARDTHLEPEPQSARPPSQASRHSISDPPAEEVADRRPDEDAQREATPAYPAAAPQVVRRRPTSHDDAEAARPGAPEKRPTILQQGSILVKESIFMNIRNDSIAMAGEFVGTILFLIVSLGAAQSVSTVSKNISGDSASQASASDRLVANLYRALATGTALYGTASIFYRFTGSIFNPSVSLALCVCGVIKPVRFILVSTSQMAGGVVAAFVLSGLLPGESTVNLVLADNTSMAQGLFIEMFATTTLILTVLMLGVEKHSVTPHAPLGFGFTLLASTLFANQYTGAGINVARAFGTACVEGFQPYHWIYWLGPTLGALLASGFYEFLKLIKYWQVNPGQDSVEPLEPVVGPRYRHKMIEKQRTQSNY